MCKWQIFSTLTILLVTIVNDNKEVALLLLDTYAELQHFSAGDRAIMSYHKLFLTTTF